MTIRVKYYWKELTSDGLLKEPREVGPYYSQESLNAAGWGFDTEEEAVERLTYVKSIHQWDFSGDYVLVKVYG